MVDVKKIEEKGNLLKVLVKGSETAFINSFRRAIMSLVPTAAIEEVTIFENDSVIFDEFLTQRLSLVPVKADLKGAKKGEKFKFKLEKEGPCTVLVKDIKPVSSGVELLGKKTPLLKLSKGQKLKLEMTATVNSGREHVKWQPAIVGYRHVSNISILKDCSFCKECIKACPKELLEIKAKKIVLKDNLLCDACAMCKDACLEKAIEVQTIPNDFVFSIETIGQRENKEIMLEAIQALKEKNSEFKKTLSAL